MKTFYHKDPDGHCAAFWVRWAMKSSTHDIVAHKENCDFIGLGYSDEFPIETILPGETVFIVDFSVSPEIMDKLLAITERVIWIDHHQTAIEKFANYPTQISGIRYTGLSGCLLTYYFFNKNNQKFVEQAERDGTELYSSKYIQLVCNNAPNFLRYISDYDTWKFELGDNSKYLHEAFRAYDTRPTESFWDGYILDLADDNHLAELHRTSQYIERGHIMTQRRNASTLEYVEMYGFERDLQGHKALVINLGNFSSDCLPERYADDYDIIAAIVKSDSGWKVSLRSSKVDVAKIAEGFGGGGHKGAAGFNVLNITDVFTDF